MKISFLACAAAIGVAATVHAEEPKYHFVPSDKKTEDATLARIQTAMSKDGRFSNVNGVVLADTFGANHLSHYLRITGNVTNGDRVFAFDMDDCPALRIMPATSISIASNAQNLENVDANVTRVEMGMGKKGPEILRAFNYGGYFDPSDRGPISIHANQEQVNAGAIVGQVVTPCISSARYAPKAPVPKKAPHTPKHG